jgi:cytochrome c-type protein NapB
VLVLTAGSSAKGGEVDDGLDVYFRDVDLGELSDQSLATYLEAEPGESDLLERAFPGAPPQISHGVEDMLPITADDNECVECHHPDNVASEEDAPIPKTHFERAVMGEGKKGGAMVWVVKTYQEGDDLAGSRYNCTMCHAQQAVNVKTPRSLFTPEKSKR